MERIASHLEWSVLIAEDEDASPVEAALRSLVPLSLDAEKLAVLASAAKGFNERKVLIERIALEHQRHIRAALAHLREMLSAEQRSLLLKQASSRLDEQMRFYLRLDKAALLAGRVELTDGGECFHCKVSLSAFPRSEQAALAVLQKWLAPS